MQNSILESIDKAQEKKRPSFRVGDRVNVFIKLKEGEKERVQAFRGVVISKQPKSGRGPRATFTVRKISEGVGVEKIFPLHSPFIEKIDVEGSSTVRRSRLYYLRSLKGKKARLKEAETFGEIVVAPTVTEVPVEQGTEITGGDVPTSNAPATAKPKDATPKK